MPRRISTSLMTFAFTSLVGSIAFTADAATRSSVSDDALVWIDGEQPAVIRRETWLTPRRLTPPHALGSAGAIAGSQVDSVFLNTGTAPEGDGPDDVVYTPDGTQVLVLHRDTDNITFFDVNTRTVTHTVAVGAPGSYPTDVAVTPNGQYAVTANVFGNSVSIIDLASHTLLAEVPVTGDQPYRVAITPDSNFAVVGVINDAENSAFSIIDLNAHQEILNFPSASQGVIGFYFTPESGGSGPLFTQFDLTPDGNTIVMPNRPGAQVILYNRNTGAATATLNTATGPTSVDISADGTLAVVGHDSPGNAITKINLVTQTIAGSFPMANILDNTAGIRITPDKSHAIAAISNNVIFVNLTTGAVASTINTGVVGDIELSHDGQYAFVSNFNARVINVNTRTLVATIPFAACVEAACSPTELRAVALNTRFREDIHFYNINGAAATFEGFASTGPAPEGDAARNLAISQDGSTLVVCHNISRNVAIVDVPSRTVQAYVEVGDRPLAAEITPDGQYAVVCATDANVVRIIDLNTHTIVSSLSINARPAGVRISPDGQWAYVINVAGTDMVSFIQLNGAASTIVSQLSNGIQLGSAQGYLYTETSGMELSPDGSILAVCDSFNDLLRLYDTATRTQIAAVAVGDFPIRVAFNPAGTRAYVTNAFSDNVSVVNINGGSSSTIATIGGIEFPLVVNVDATGSFAYVGNTDGNNPRLYVINAATNSIATSLALSDPARDSHYAASENVLYLALTDGNLARINAAGASSSIIDVTPLPGAGAPSDLVYSEAAKIAVTAQPVPDGVDIIDYDPAPACAADINQSGAVDVADLLAVINAWGSAGGPADIDGSGTVDVADLLAVINAWGPCP